jgi:hypothetical protein
MIIKQLNNRGIVPNHVVEMRISYGFIGSKVNIMLNRLIKLRHK